MEGGLKRAAPTRSARSLRPGAKETAAHPPRPRCFGSARAQAAAGASVSCIKWDEHGAGLFWGSRGRSRYEGDPRTRAQQRSDRDPIVPDSPRYSGRSLARRSQHGVQPGTGSLQWWLWGEARGPARAQLSSRAASRRARGEARGNHEAPLQSLLAIFQFRWQHARNRISAFSCWRQVAFGIAFF